MVPVTWVSIHLRVIAYIICSADSGFCVRRVRRRVTEGGITRGLSSTFSCGVQRLHIEDVNTLHLSQNLKTLQAGGLIQVRGNSTDRCAGGEQVVFRLDLCSACQYPSHTSNPATVPPSTYR
jgi:hypothetical protein